MAHRVRPMMPAAARQGVRICSHLRPRSSWAIYACESAVTIAATAAINHEIGDARRCFNRDFRKLRELGSARLRNDSFRICDVPVPEGAAGGESVEDQSNRMAKYRRSQQAAEAGPTTRSIASGRCFDRARRSELRFCSKQRPKASPRRRC